MKQRRSGERLAGGAPSSRRRDDGRRRRAAHVHLIEEDDRRLCEEHARDRDALPLPAAQTRPARAARRAAASAGCHTAPSSPAARQQRQAAASDAARGSAPALAELRVEALGQFPDETVGVCQARRLRHLASRRLLPARGGGAGGPEESSFSSVAVLEGSRICAQTTSASSRARAVLHAPGARTRCCRGSSRGRAPAPGSPRRCGGGASGRRAA